MKLQSFVALTVSAELYCDPVRRRAFIRELKDLTFARAMEIMDADDTAILTKIIHNVDRSKEIYTRYIDLVNVIEYNTNKEPIE